MAEPIASKNNKRKIEDEEENNTSRGNNEQKIKWSKYHPYTTQKLPLTPPNTKPTFTKHSPALCLHIHSQSNRARQSTLHLPHGPVQLPTFMPVGTKGSLKGLTMEEVELYNISLMLCNTYHLALEPTTEVVDAMGGCHKFINYTKNLLTDSGGFQMVSLLKFATIDEKGVTFKHPTTDQELILRPEDSIKHQNNIGADIIMALDDVVSSTNVDQKRFEEATYRTIRWLDRCMEAHAKKEVQNLFPIVQGGLDTRLREICLEAFRERDEMIPGYAIGGLSGGEEKESFVKIVDFCCKALPDVKPRYLMGVGYPLDIVVCTALGVDMYDCVYPTRTARFGAALVNSKDPGTIRLKNTAYRNDNTPICDKCQCQACKYYTKSQLHFMLKGSNESLGVQLMTHHNLCYMMTLMKDIRAAISRGQYKEFVHDFIKMFFPDENNSEKGYVGRNVPTWVKHALIAADIPL